ncbi:MAG TPA: DUF4157 domain-containing protein [Blastocatellia bacterium]|nr:DUF4157 domain-containing protein [Blastocatellia bacterium]
MKTALQTQMKAPTESSFTPVHTGLLLRKCACGGSPGVAGECGECGKQRLSLQRSTRDPKLDTRNSGGAPPSVHEVLRSPGRPLDAATRALFEPRFGHDFTSVRVHNDAQAAKSARAVNALAYTVGRDIVFGDGRYAPDTSAGQRLMAHELTHTIQQSRNPMLMPTNLRIGEANDLHEQEADRVADQVSAVHREASGARGQLPVMSTSRVEPHRVARELATPEDAGATPQVTTPEDAGATSMSTGPECSRSRRNSQNLPLASTPFRGDRGFASIPADGHPGPGGLIVTRNSVSITISARWEEQIPNPAQRPRDQQHRRADSPQYYLTFDGWVDACTSPGQPGSSASSIQSGNLAIGTQQTVSFASLIPGRYGLSINPSTASPEPNRVLTGDVAVA